MDYKKIYIDFLKKFLNVNRPLTVVFDASNGPTGMLMEDLWEGTNVRAILLNTDIDPDFKAHGPNPLVEGASDVCAEEVRKNRADLGVIFDADGDRAIFLDDEGSIVPACFISTLIFQGSKPPYVADELVYQSLTVLKIIPEKNIIPSCIGAFLVKEQMRDNAASVGAEYSGHYYFKDFFNADSGILAAITVLNALSKMDLALSKWNSRFGKHIILSREVRAEGMDVAKLYSDLENKYSTLTKRIEKRDGLTFIFNDCWINVRLSNTEPIIRIIGGGGDNIQGKISELERFVGTQ